MSSLVFLGEPSRLHTKPRARSCLAASGGARGCGGFYDEREQICVDLVLMCGGQAMGRAGVIELARIAYEPSCFFGGAGHRYDLVIFAVYEQRRYGDLSEIFREVCFGKR